MPIPNFFSDSATSTHREKLADTTDSHVAEVGVDAQQIPAPGEQHKQGEMVSDGTSAHARQLSVEKRWSQEAPVDGARSRRLSGTVYGLRILPLPAENAPRQ